MLVFKLEKGLFKPLGNIFGRRETPLPVSRRPGPEKLSFAVGYNSGIRDIGKGSARGHKDSPEQNNPYYG
jgi:hypothetical protein